MISLLKPLGGSAPEPEREINGFGWWSLTLLLSALHLHRVPTQPHLCHPPAAVGWFISANLLSLKPTLPSSSPTCVFTRALSDAPSPHPHLTRREPVGAISRLCVWWKKRSSVIMESHYRLVQLALLTYQTVCRLPSLNKKVWFLSTRRVRWRYGYSWLK